MIKLKSQKAPQDEVHSVTYEEVLYSPKELLEFSLFSKNLMSKRGNGFNRCRVMVAKTFIWIREILLI